MRKMKDSGIAWIGEIPEEWAVERIKSNLRRRTIRDHSECEVLSLYREYGVLPKNSRDDNHNVTSEDTSKYLFVRNGDFVVNKMKAWQGSVGFSQYEGIVSPAYYVYEFTSKKYNGMFFHYLLRGCYKDEFRRLSAGIREGQWDLPACEFENTLAILPPLAEQQRIADYLDAQCAKIDSTIVKTQQIIEKLKAYKQSVITEAVTKGLNPDAPMKDSGIEWIGEIPEHWSVCRIFHLAKFINGYSFDSGDFDNSKEVPVVRIGDIQNDRINFESCTRVDKNSELDNFNVKNNDVVIAMSGATTGKSAFVTNAEYAYTNQRVGIIRSKNYNKYIFYSIYGKRFFTHIELLAAGSAQPNISMGSILNFKITLPPEHEANEITSHLDDKCAKIDGYIAKKQEVIEKLTAYKKSLIFEVVTGKREI